MVITLGVITEAFYNEGPARVLEGIRGEADRRGLVLEIVAFDGADSEAASRAVAQFGTTGVAGVITTAQTDVVEVAFRTADFPGPVVIDTPRISDGADTTEQLVGRLQAAHLLDLGHQRVGYVSGLASSYAAQERESAFCGAIRGRGATVAWRRQGDWSVRSGQLAWESLSDTEREVSAIATGNDEIAMGVIAGVAGSGMAVPTDVSVIGVDDMEAAVRNTPSLSTVALDFEGEGRFMVDELMKRISLSKLSGDESLMRLPTLVKRDSTAPFAESPNRLSH